MRRPTRLSIVWLFSVLSSVQAQVETEIDRGVPIQPYSVSRSQSFTLSTGDLISVRPFGDVRLELEFSVYSGARQLMAKEDPGNNLSRFEWIAPKAGSFYVFARNVSEVPGSFQVTLRKGARAAGHQPPPFAEVRVFYASARKPSGDAKAAPFYSDSEAVKDYAVGTAVVTIPTIHQTGELEEPAIYRLVDRGNKSEFVELESVTPFKDRNLYFRTLSEQVRKTARQEALVFIHGFNVSFEDAARRTAQMSYDLGFGGAGIFFAWPSLYSGAPTPGAYKNAGENARECTESLKTFLKDLCAHTDAKTIFLVAHSMGNRLLTTALKEIGDEHGQERFKEVALMAPDISVNLFRSLAASMRLSADRITLYASSRDKALIISEKLNSERRAGQSKPDVLTVPGVDTVDASSVHSDAFTFYHSYYADNVVMLSELYHLLRGDPPEVRFGLERAGTGETAHWRFRKYSR